MVEGERILGRFTVGERLGSGGNGTVHRAWDERLCRDVAVKAVPGAPAGRVLREAQAAARLNHPGIVTLYELGEQGGTAYLVSELVRGPNLRELAAAGRLSDRELAELGAGLCGALEHAHAQGVVHRDLKPDNVLVRRRGRRTRALLADFGIAAVADEPTLTATGQVLGTLAYMAPEQAAGQPATAASDVYSLSLSLYELWTGANPVRAATPAATARRIGRELPPLAGSRPDLPEELGATLDAALEPDPELRPALGELQQALERSTPELDAEAAVPEPELRPEELPDRAPERRRSGRALAIVAGLLALALVSGRTGLALLLALAAIPAATFLERPRDWLAPAAAPLLGLAGLAPLFLVFAARAERTSARLALAGLAWAWTAIAGAILGLGLGVLETDGAAAGWTHSIASTADELLAPLLGSEAIAVALVWIGATILLGALLDTAGAALLALGGMVWAAALIAALAAVGGAAGPGVLLTPALVVAIAWLVWDRAGRPLPEAWGASEPPVAPTVPRSPRNPAAAPLAHPRAQAARAASRHVDAALHGAGTTARLP